MHFKDRSVVTDTWGGGALNSRVSGVMENFAVRRKVTLARVRVFSVQHVREVGSVGTLAVRPLLEVGRV